MHEPEIPLPPSEENSHWDPAPVRCGTDGCRNILRNFHPYQGWRAGFCSTHGRVLLSQNSEMKK